jgi:hypothetical protein
MTTEISMGVVDAANFVSSALLISLGVIIVVATILIINNLFNRYWRPVKVFTYIAAKISAEDAANMEENRVDRIEPRIEQPKKPMQPQVVK